MNKIETIYELKDLAAQSGMTLTAIQVPRSASSRLRDTLAAWKDTRTLLTPYDYDDKPKVYYQPRYPSKPPIDRKSVV